MKKLLTTILAGLTIALTADAGSLTLLHAPEKTEVQPYFRIDLGKMSFDQYVELTKSDIYSETGAQVPLTESLSIVEEHTGIKGKPDHERIGLMGKTPIKGIDLMVRAMYDTKQDLHVRAKAKMPTKYGTLVYLLADMDKTGHTHQRITYQTPKLGSLSGIVQAKLTSADGEGATFYVGTEISK